MYMLREPTPSLYLYGLVMSYEKTLVGIFSGPGYLGFLRFHHIPKCLMINVQH